MSLTLEEMSAKPKNQILEQMAHSPKISLEQMASKPKIGPAPPSRTLPIPEPEALSYGGHTGFFTDIAEPKEIGETIKQTDPEYERKVQHAISIIESYSPKEQAYILGVLPFTNPLNISTWLSTKGIETPKGMPEGEAHKYTTAALHDAIGRYSQKMKLSDPRKWASIAGLIGKTVLEFRGAPGKSAATRFAARELMTLPTKQEADMPFMDYVISKGERVGEAAAMGYGVGAAHKYIPQAGLRIPAVTGGFMGVTALRGGSPQEILETGATILGFEALGLIEKSTKAVKRTVRNRYATEAVKAARKYNPDLNKLSNKQVEQVLQGIAENRQAMALSSKQAHNEARELVKLAQQQKKAGNRSLFDEVKQVMTKGTGAERDRLLADLYRKTQRPAGPTETTQQAMIAEPQPLTAGRKPVKPTIPTPPAEKVAPTEATGGRKPLGAQKLVDQVPVKAAKEIKPPAKPAEAKGKGKPGFVDLNPVLESHKAFMRVLEPAKAVERKLGKEAYAAVIKGIHATDVARVKFEQTELPKKDKVINELEEWLDKFSDKDLDNLMLSRGDPVSVEAQLIKKDATNKLPKELRSPKLLGSIQHIADFNYKYLQSVVGDDINRVSEYFYGIYKDSKKVDKFLDYWRTTKRFTKEKKLPTYADAKSYGLEIRDPNPVRNLKSEYIAIAHLEGMNWLKDELMRTGEGKFIDNLIDAPVEWDKVQDPAFSGLRLQPDLAKLINNLIATNKITKVPIINTLRQVNNFLRTVKFIGSAFHLLSVAKQSVADSGYLGFYKIAEFYKRPGKRIPFGVRKGMATQGITFGFRKNDPTFRTPFYKRYVRNGGGHRYSVESEARKAFVKFANKFNKEFGKAVKYGAIPIKLPVSFVNWMFNSYIPKVKYAKTQMWYNKQAKKLGRELTDAELQEIIKEGQNFYGMVNERLFGRSGTWTTVLRFFFMAPGYAEGNFRTILKSALQWKGKDGFSANRSRSNIVNSLIITSILATVGTMIMTGKPPKKPETAEDLRDLFKIDTGKTDDKGRRIMIDLMTYDKDYWNVYGNMFLGEPGKAIETSIKRVGGMTATTAEVAADLLLISQGRAVYDWKGDRVTEITDPFLRKVMKLAVYEIKKTEPISWSVFKQSRRKEIDTTIAAVETLLGYRPTMSEKDKREQAITNRIYSLKGQQEKLYQYLGTLKNPRGAIDHYNKTVNQILDSKMVPKKMREEWKPKLIIDLDKYLQGKAHTASLQATTKEAKQKVERAIELLKNFGVTAEEADKLLLDYYEREKKKAGVSPLERHPVIGRGLKQKRLKERMEGEQ